MSRVLKLDTFLTQLITSNKFKFVEKFELYKLEASQARLDELQLLVLLQLCFALPKFNIKQYTLFHLFILFDLLISRITHNYKIFYIISNLLFYIKVRY